MRQKKRLSWELSHVDQRTLIRVRSENRLDFVARRTIPNRKEIMLHRSLRGVAAIVMAFALIVNFACSPAKLARTADRGATACRKTKPIIQDLIDTGGIGRDKGEAILEKLSKGESTFTALATAFRDGDNAGALGLANTLVDVVDQLIATDVLAIKDPAKRTLVLAFLSAADLALGIIGDDLAREVEKAPVTAVVARASNTSSLDAIEAYVKKKRLRARDATTGRFVTMDYAKANPSTTVIERY